MRNVFYSLVPETIEGYYRMERQEKSESPGIADRMEALERSTATSVRRLELLLRADNLIVSEHSRRIHQLESDRILMVGCLLVLLGLSAALLIVQVAK